MQVQLMWNIHRCMLTAVNKYKIIEMRIQLTDHNLNLTSSNGEVLVIVHTESFQRKTIVATY